MQSSKEKVRKQAYQTLNSKSEIRAGEDLGRLLCWQKPSARFAPGFYDPLCELDAAMYPTLESAAVEQQVVAFPTSGQCLVVILQCNPRISWEHPQIKLHGVEKWSDLQTEVFFYNEGRRRVQS